MPAGPTLVGSGAPYLVAGAEPPILMDEFEGGWAKPWVGSLSQRGRRCQSSQGIITEEIMVTHSRWRMILLIPHL